MDAFSLTPALSRLERGNRQQRLLMLDALGSRMRGELVSLSQRERAGVRENGPDSNRRAHILGEFHLWI